jgi:two-component system OmpR family response regulator
MLSSEKINSPIRILVVDDEPSVCSLLRSGLEAEGYAVSEARSSAELWSCLKTAPINLITLDLSLDGEDGLQIAREVRARYNVPIIMITGKGAPIDRVVGLEQGADDYIVKPFHIQEVLIRVSSVLRRYGSTSGSEGAGSRDDISNERYEFEGGVLDILRRNLTAADGKIIDLTDVEFDLLVIFLRQPSRIFSRDELTQILRGRNWSPEDRVVDGHVARLRRKIDSQGEMPRLIKSVRGVGYVFTGDVKRLDGF